MFLEVREGIQGIFIYCCITNYLQLSDIKQHHTHRLYLCCMKPGTSTEKPPKAEGTQTFRGRIIWRHCHSHVWCLGWDDLKAGLSWDCQNAYSWPLCVAWASSQYGSLWANFFHGGSGFHARLFQWTKQKQHMCCSQPSEITQHRFHCTAV